MNKIAIITAILISAMLSVNESVCAQSYGKGKGISLYDTSKTVTITGEGELTVEPDLYKVEFEISDAFCKKGETIETLFERIKSILKSEKVSLDSLKLRSSKKEADYLGTSDDLTETRRYQVKLYSKETFEAVMSKIKETQLIVTYLKEVKNTKLNTYKTQVYEQAMKDAKNKAETIAKINGQSIESSLLVSELDFNINGGLENSYRDEQYYDNSEILYNLYLKLQVVYKVK